MEKDKVPCSCRLELEKVTALFCIDAEPGKISDAEQKANDIAQKLKEGIQKMHALHHSLIGCQKGPGKNLKYVVEWK